MIVGRCGVVMFALCLMLAPAARAEDDDAVVQRQTRLLEEVTSRPDGGIPLAYLAEARGLLIVPGMTDTELGVGRIKGHGIYVIRDSNGKWGAPLRADYSGVRVGPKVGRKVIDTIKIYRTERAVERVHGKHQFLLGFDVGALGQLEREPFHSVGKLLDLPRSDVLVYRRTRGILVGATITGEHRWFRENSAAAPAPTNTLAPRADVVAGPVNPKAAAPIAVDSNATKRLKAALAALTPPTPLAPIATTNAKDANVLPASATKGR